ncbi:probable G-protein coupled receptor 142 [Ovis aries]|uniref:probable G-protein coupled receptor 142 n=1 Tax=Ovis aries TaxID=9940 RepID=UPI00295274F6|nr:probable G-protein coupled receptor 142 [Ovis aries]
MRLAEKTAAQLRVTLLPTPNSSGLSQELEGRWPESPAASPCVAGVIPVIYYSILLGLGLPGEWGVGSGVQGWARNWGPPSILHADL